MLEGSHDLHLNQNQPRLAQTVARLQEIGMRMDNRCSTYFLMAHGVVRIVEVRVKLFAKCRVILINSRYNKVELEVYTL